jgi:CDGSH-type Zn-finger protein
MELILGVLAICFASIVIVAIKESYKEKVVRKKCGCGKSPSGYCDDSHNNTDENKDNASGI